LNEDRAGACLTMLRERVGELPAHARSVLARRGELPSLGAARSIAVTGVGGSEGPARYLCALLRHAHGLRAAFLPVSCFAAAGCDVEAETLVVFSQGLSPNARLILAGAGRYAATVLYTTLAPGSAEGAAAAVLDRLDRARTQVATLPPRDESATLVRLVGPSVASLAAALTASELRESDAAELDRIPGLWASASARVEAATRDLEPEWLFGHVAFVTAGQYGEAYHAPGWKWLEGLGVPEPSSWDVLQVAHGAFQQFYDDRILLVCLESGRAEEHLLFDRLASMLVPERHRMLRLTTPLPRHLALLDHDVQVTHLFLQALAHRPRDLTTWPGFGLDGPLYGLDCCPGSNP
jgi:fructoselysine-6-P-deglycase FrlB-like protein